MSGDSTRARCSATQQPRGCRPQRRAGSWAASRGTRRSSSSRRTRWRAAPWRPHSAEQSPRGRRAQPMRTGLLGAWVALMKMEWTGVMLRISRMTTTMPTTFDPVDLVGANHPRFLPRSPSSARRHSPRTRRLQVRVGRASAYPRPEALRRPQVALVPAAAAVGGPARPTPTPCFAERCSHPTMVPRVPGPCSGPTAHPRADGLLGRRPRPRVSTASPGRWESARRAAKERRRMGVSERTKKARM